MTVPTARSRRLAACFWIALSAWLLFLRAPSYTSAFFDPDVAATVYSARLFAEGSCIYPDAVETKPPGAYAVLALLLAIGRTMTGVHLLVAAMHLGIAVAIARAVGRSAGRAAGRLAALAYATYSALGFVNGYAPNFETWTIAPLVLAALVLLPAHEASRWRFLAAGMFAGTAILMKQQALFVGGALGVAAVLLPTGKRVRRVDRGLLFAAGFVAPGAVVLAFFAAKGCVGDLWTAIGPAHGASYVAANEPGEVLNRAGRFFAVFGRHAAPLIASAVGGLVVLLLRPRSEIRVIACLWIAGAFAATCAGTMFFPHYATFLVAPLSVLAGVGLGRATERAGSRLAQTGIAIAAAAFLIAGVPREARLAAIAARDIATTGSPESRDLFQANASFGYEWRHVALGISHLELDLVARAVGEYIRARTRPDEPILVYDYVPAVYWYADRRAPTRHYMNFDVARELPPDYGRWFAEENDVLRANRAVLMRDLADRPPRYVVRVRRDRPLPITPEPRFFLHNFYGDPMTFSEWRAPLFPDLAAFVGRHYRPAPDAPDGPLFVLERDDTTFR
jgi:hypothetical protein